MTLALYFALSALAGLLLGAWLAKLLKPRPKNERRAIAEQVERMRNLLSFMLVTAFIGALLTLTFKAIPSENKDLLTYMLGQLSGMATTALGFYFVNKAGQDAVDAKRADTTRTIVDLAADALKSGTGDGAGTADTKQAEAKGAEEAAGAAGAVADEKAAKAAGT